MTQNKWHGKIWEGVYKNFEEAPGETGVFNMSHWLLKQKDQLNKKIDLIERETNVEISHLAESRDYYLSIIIGIESYKKTIKVLDFGGGLASSYLEALSTIPNKENVEFLVVENPEICKMDVRYLMEIIKFNFLPSYHRLIQVLI